MTDAQSVPKASQTPTVSEPPSHVAEKKTPTTCPLTEAQRRFLEEGCHIELRV
jgi:hypothetical protein